jgi:hypothetical protein
VLALVDSAQELHQLGGIELTPIARQMAEIGKMFLLHCIQGRLTVAPLRSTPLLN